MKVKTIRARHASKSSLRSRRVTNGFVNAPKSLKTLKRYHSPDVMDNTGGKVVTGKGNGSALKPRLFVMSKASENLI
jgi:hypothetical protein